MFFVFGSILRGAAGQLPLCVVRLLLASHDVPRHCTWLSGDTNQAHYIAVIYRLGRGDPGFSKESRSMHIGGYAFWECVALERVLPSEYYYRTHQIIAFGRVSTHLNTCYYLARAAVRRGSGSRCAFVHIGLHILYRPLRWTPPPWLQPP